MERSIVTESSRSYLEKKTYRRYESSRRKRTQRHCTQGSRSSYGAVQENARACLAASRDENALSFFWVKRQNRGDTLLTTFFWHLLLKAVHASGAIVVLDVLLAAVSLELEGASLSKALKVSSKVSSKSRVCVCVSDALSLCETQGGLSRARLRREREEYPFHLSN